MIRSLLLAVQFLTIFPLQLQGVTPKNLTRSMAFYPLIGAVLGGVLYGAFLIMGSFFSDFISSALVVLLWIFLTGGFHLDGLADTLDGFVGGKDKKTALTLMRDPAIGTMGALGIFSVLIMKGAALFSIAEQAKYLLNSLVFVPAAGRYLMVFGSFVSRYPHPEGTGKNYIGKIPLSVFVIASVFMLLIAAAFFHLKGLMFVMVSLMGTGLWVFYCHKRIDGMTGDNLGALGEVSEAVLLLLLTAKPV